MSRVSQHKCPTSASPSVPRILMPRVPKNEERRRKPYRSVHTDLSVSKVASVPRASTTLRRCHKLFTSPHKHQTLLPRRLDKNPKFRPWSNSFHFQSVKSRVPSKNFTRVTYQRYRAKSVFEECPAKGVTEN